MIATSNTYGSRPIVASSAPAKPATELVRDPMKLLGPIRDILNDMVTAYGWDARLMYRDFALVIMRNTPQFLGSVLPNIAWQITEDIHDGKTAKEAKFARLRVLLVKYNSGRIEHEHGEDFRMTLSATFREFNSLLYTHYRPAGVTAPKPVHTLVRKQGNVPELTAGGAVSSVYQSFSVDLSKPGVRPPA